MIERQVDRMTELINDLLDVSEMMPGRLRMKIEDVDLTAVARDIAARLRGPLADAGCELILEAETPRAARRRRVRSIMIRSGSACSRTKRGPRIRYVCRAARREGCADRRR
jgi:signal transduction histidine kinase